MATKPRLITINNDLFKFRHVLATIALILLLGIGTFTVLSLIGDGIKESVREIAREEINDKLSSRPTFRGSSGGTLYLSPDGTQMCTQFADGTGYCGPIPSTR